MVESACIATGAGLGSGASTIGSRRGLPNPRDREPVRAARTRATASRCGLPGPAWP